jgi:hypothetical protein
MIRHPYIVAWNQGSPANYVAQLLERAKREGAPQRAICPLGAQWSTIDDVENEMAIDCWEFVGHAFGADAAGPPPQFAIQSPRAECSSEEAA